MKYLLVITSIAGFAAAATLAFAQQPPQSLQQGGLLDFLRQATVSIGTVSLVGGKQVYATAGSGIVVSDGHIGCLLTARHMFYDPSRGWMPTQVSIRMPPVTGKETVDFGVILSLVGSGANIWKSPNDGADLAVIRMPDMSKYKDVKAVSPKAFGGEDDIYQGAQILALGYPALLGEDFLTTPYARGGIISWTDIADPVNKPFLVDANLFPGNSGGPVFHMRNGFAKNGSFTLGGGAALIGIVSKGAEENAPVVAGGVPIVATNNQTGQVSPAQAMVLGIGGIGIIEPVSRAKSILQDCLHPSPDPTIEPAPPNDAPKP